MSARCAVKVLFCTWNTNFRGFHEWAKLRNFVPNEKDNPIDVYTENVKTTNSRIRELVVLPNSRTSVSKNYNTFTVYRHFLELTFFSNSAVVSRKADGAYPIIAPRPCSQVLVESKLLICFFYLVCVILVLYCVCLFSMSSFCPLVTFIDYRYNLGSLHYFFLHNGLIVSIPVYWQKRKLYFVCKKDAIT